MQCLRSVVSFDRLHYSLTLQLALLGVAEFLVRQVPGPPHDRILPHGGHGQQHPPTALPGMWLVLSIWLLG